jgi:hypothetical protein
VRLEAEPGLLGREDGVGSSRVFSRTFSKVGRCIFCGRLVMECKEEAIGFGGKVWRCWNVVRCGGGCWSLGEKGRSYGNNGNGNDRICPCGCLMVVGEELG